MKISLSDNVKVTKTCIPKSKRKIIKSSTAIQALVKYTRVNGEDGFLEYCGFRTPLGYDFTKYVIKNEIGFPGKVVEVHFFLKPNQYLYNFQEDDKSIKYMFYRVPKSFHIKKDILENNLNINFPQILYKEAKIPIPTQGQRIIGSGIFKTTVFLKPN